jgi:hypothetical protein
MNGAVAGLIENTTGWSIKKFVTTARRYRTRRPSYARSHRPPRDGDTAPAHPFQPFANNGNNRPPVLNTHSGAIPQLCRPKQFRTALYLQNVLGMSPARRGGGRAAGAGAGARPGELTW